jgi:lysophospholipase L1-like esterase
MIRIFLWVAVAVFLFSTPLQAQKQFADEVDKLVAGDSVVNTRKVILFTGSSSVRMWKDLKAHYPNHNVLNRGFGGSQMTDLLYFFDKLILPYRPSMIFIYEGDNDLASKKTTEQILATADSLLTLIRTQVSKKVPVVFISAKPSLSRWTMKDQYVAFNSSLKAWTESKKNVRFVDVWTPMLDANGEPRKDIFIEDGLHMNKTGYDIWAAVIRPYLK